VLVVLWRYFKLQQNQQPRVQGVNGNSGKSDSKKGMLTYLFIYSNVKLYNKVNQP